MIDLKILWQMYLVALLIAGVALVAFPIRRWKITRTRDRAFLTAVALVTLGFVGPVAVIAPLGSIGARVGISLFMCIPSLMLIGVYAIVRGGVIRGQKTKAQQNSGP